MRIFLLIFFVACGWTAVAQSNSLPDPETQAVLERMRAIKVFDTTVLENADYLEPAPDNGCALTGWYDGEVLWHMRSWVAYAWGIEQFDYYFISPERIYVEEQNQRYVFNAQTGEIDYSRTELSYTAHYLFENMQLITRTEQRHNGYDDPSVHAEHELVGRMSADVEKLQNARKSD